MTNESEVKLSLAVGAFFLALAVGAHAVIISSNVSFVSHSFGTVVLLAYLLAAMGLIFLPLVLERVPRPRATKTLLVGFCSWITMEENLHASEGWHAPAGASSLLKIVFAPEIADKLTLLAFVFLIYGVMEVVAHLGHAGLHMFVEAHKQLPHNHKHK